MLNTAHFEIEKPNLIYWVTVAVVKDEVWYVDSRHPHEPLSPYVIKQHGSSNKIKLMPMANWSYT